MTLTLLNGDCLKMMKSIADKSIDLIICDLPFGCLHPERKRDESKWYDSAGQARGSCSWDVKIDLKIFWDEIKRIRKDDHTPCLMFCTTKFGFDLYNSNPKEFRYDLVWDKQRGVSFLSANKMPMRSHEMIYVFSKAGANYNRVDISGNYKAVGGGCKPSKVYGGAVGEQQPPTNEGKRCALSVIDVANSAGKGKHPTEKPIELYKFLIERYSKKGDRVLDPTFGSGNSGLASKELDRNYIGIEKDNIFFWKFCKKVLPQNYSADS